MAEAKSRVEGKMNDKFYFHGEDQNILIDFNKVKFIDGSIRENGEHKIKIDFKNNKESIRGLLFDGNNQCIFNIYKKYKEKKMSDELKNNEKQSNEKQSNLDRLWEIYFENLDLANQTKGCEIEKYMRMCREARRGIETATLEHKVPH